MSRSGTIGRSFGAAVESYERSASLQRLVAERLADRIVAGIADRGRATPRILEIGCGTGLLTRALRHRMPCARIVATDLSAAMLQACRDRMAGDDRLHLLAMDGMQPAVAGGFDLVCTSLALQWFADPAAAVRLLAGALAPGGRLHAATLVADTLPEWRAAHAAEGLVDGGLDHPDVDRLAGRCGGDWQVETIIVPFPDGLAFLRGLRGIGARLPAEGRAPIGPGQMRRVLRRFEKEHGSTVSYRVAYGSLGCPARRGVFVAGTDTGIGKTLVSACLARAWTAEYWKPLQTGLDDDPGDSTTVRMLGGVPPERVHRPAVELRASLSPEDAAALNGDVIDPRLTLPKATSGDAPLVVEGAGGVLVPVTPDMLTVGLIAQFGLPVVLVARSTLGTINHTLLSLEALRRRGIRVAGVILNGPASPGNRSAIERHGKVRVLAEIPPQQQVDASTVERLAKMMPAFETLEKEGQGAALDPEGDGRPLHP